MVLYDWLSLVGAVVVGVGLGMAWLPLGVCWAGAMMMILGVWGAYNAAYTNADDG